MSCVNKSSKEFKALAANNGISANTLELITHKYWLETGSEENFPTDVYIQAQLGNSQYKEDIPEVRKLWDKRYKYPRQYSSYEEVRRAYEEAAKVFPLSSIVYYKNSNGNYTLSVKQPVEKVYNTASDFFNQDLSGAKNLNLDLEDGKTYGIDKVQELYNRFNTDRTSKYLANKVFKTAKDLGITVSFNEELPFGKTGRYKNDNSIVYKKSFLERDAMTGLKASVLLHEVIHAISMYALSKNTKNWSRSKDLEKFRTEVNDIFSKVRYNDALKGERGIHDVYEFVAELANPIFRQKLQSIDNRSWWTKLVDAVKNLLGIHTSSTYYNRSMRALNNALEAFDLDSYLRYNGLKSPLQQAYNEHRVDYDNMSEDELKSMLKDTIKETDTSLDNKDINKTIDDYVNGKEQFNNLTKEENDTARRDKLLAGGEVAARIHGSSNREESQDERNERQEKQVEDWAKKAGAWHEDALSYGMSFGNEVQGGQESHVYVNERNKSVIKVKATTQYHDLQEFLDGIVLHNTIFPETAYKVLGFGNDGEGFVAILEQPFIVGEEPTQEQITEYVKSKVPDAEMYEEELGNDRYKTSQTLLHDLSPRNAIITPNGNIAIIDDIIRPNIASEEKGGTRSDDYSISPTNQELSSLIDSMTKEQLVSELNHIKQEYADYDLVATDDEDSSNDKIKDKSFTFNDGITVPTPFRLNNQQADALNVMNDFIHSDDTTMTLSGYAGTGKTSLMEIMAQKARRDGKLIMFCATTNKAAAVLKSKVSRQGFDAQTLNKLFGINVEVDTNKAYDAKNLVNKLKGAQIPYGTTVIIDEASMINEENYRILNQVARENGLKIIYVGDRAQLAPVGEDKVSKVFRNTDGKVVELTKVERTDDNAILKEATNVRNGKPLSGVSSFNDKGEGVAFINPKGEHRQAIVDVIKHYVQGLKKDPNHFRILAYTNKAVSQYNNYVRKLLGYNDNTPRVGEPIIGYANWGYHWQTKTYDFINSESYKVTKVEQPTIKSIQVSNRDVRMNVTPITLENSLGEKNIFDFMDIKGNAANREAATLLAIMKAKLWERARRASKAEKRDIYAQINAIDSFLFVNDNITDAQGHYLQSKTFDYGYALTVHKSQGSTFTNVLLDENDISKARNNDASNALASVDLGEETTNNPETSTLESSEDVDLGFDFGDSKTEEQQDNDVANMKQQLDYVGISRATDTVTVVSDNAKKEDSPLNHLKGKKEVETPANQQTINNEENRSNNVEIYHGNWSRSDVEKQTDKVFLFGDNTNDRVNTHHVPTMTQAVIRGLPNAIGIDTKKDRGTSESSYFTDADFDTFKKQVDEAIQKAIDSGKTIVIPEGGIGTGKAMLDRKAPKLYKYLQEQLDKLKNNSNDIQSRGLVQTVSTGNLKINWQSEGSRGGSKNTQEGVEERQNSNNSASQGSSRPLADVAKQVSQVSDALDKVLADKGIRATKQKVHKATSQEFHDAIASTKKDNPNGWMVDVHDVSDYNNCLTMLTEDCKSGIAVTKDGDIISVFSGVSRDNRLEKLMQMAIAAGGRKLDCYYLDKGITLPKLYSRFGFKVDAVTPFDEQYAPSDYKEWQEKNPDRKVEGVAAMSLKVDDSIDGYSKENTPDIDEAPSFSSYDEMLDYRDNQRVSLPGYEYFNDFQENTKVDASWKIPLLRDLDSQLSNENTAEQNQEIINKMNDILKANVEEDIKENSSKKEEGIQKSLNEYEKLNKEFDNLLEGQFDTNGEYAQGEETNLKDFDVKFTAEEINHLSELIGNYMSDMITRLQTEKGLASQLFPELKFKDGTDFTNMSRKEIVDTIGVNNLVNRAKYDFDPQNNVIDFDNEDVILKAALALENWDALMLKASTTFSFNEGYGIRRDYDKGGFDTAEEHSQIAYDDFNDYQDEDSIEEQYGDSQEQWQIDQRTVDVMNSMSELVRQGLHECYELDSDGNKVIDKNWKLPLRVNPRKATNSILRWVKGSLTLQDMINKLQEKQGSNPWLSQLIERLSDTSGKETDFQSQFFGVFSKPFQLYNIILVDGKKYTSITVNSHPALTEAMNTITTQYKIGEHPLFNVDGRINSKLLGSEKTVADSNNFNLHQALSNMQTIADGINHGEKVDSELIKEASKWLTGVSRSLGYDVTEDMVADVLNGDTIKDMTKYLNFMVRDLDSAYKAQSNNPKKTYQPFAYGADNNIGGALRNFLKPITDSLEDTAISAFYDSGKMYQSYVTPSFMTKLMTKFKSLKGQDFTDFIMKEYGNSEWFRKPMTRLEMRTNGGWRNDMLRLLATTEEARNVFDFHVELNFNKHNYMRNMTDSEYTLSLITEYFSDGWQTNKTDTSWYRMPMESNKPSSEFFRFYSYRGTHYKDTITNSLYKMFLQELSRIQTVKMRNLSKSDDAFIKNFDTNGRKFNFLPFLNSYLDNSKEAKAGRTLLRNADGTISKDNDYLAELIQRKSEGLEENKLTSDEEAALESMVHQAIRSFMDNRVSEILDSWEKNGIMDAARSVKNIVQKDDLLKENAKEGEDKNEYVKQSLENFIWNDFLAANNILQLTVGDISFYKDAEDLQKRLAQLHAPGTRGNIYATDYNGNRVSDGKYRTVILKDFDTFISSIIDNIAEVFDRRIARAPESDKEQLRALKEHLVGKDGEYRKINVADAQGFSSPSSYRKKAFIFGKWNRHAEDVYQKLLKGDYKYDDLKVAFQPLKPFVYTHLEKNLGVPNAPIQTMHVPFQAKNSEYLLIMADAIMQGETLKSGKLSRPNLLRAIYRVMQESEEKNPTKGIDTVQFESAIKSGLQGAIDIHQFADMAGGEEAAYSYLNSHIYNTDGSYNTDTTVHEADFGDYCLQQEVPEHFKNHSQAHGSQIRMIIPSDLDYYKNPMGDKTSEDNINYYEWTEPDGTKRKVTATEFKKEYEETIATNIEDSINSLQQELHLDSLDKRERNIALSKILQREILSSPRYGVDLLQACSVDKATGEFRIPKGDPIQSKRIEQLINSIIKNRVNKQKIAGGPIVQVTNFGTSRQLHIRFNDKNGNLLKTEDEFNNDDKLKEQYKTYKQYTKENQAGIAYFEVFLPMWDDDLYNKFADENGNIDMEAVENADPELTRMVSYRIPTEDKYSMAPMKAVGFMPREAGDAIMLPYELTTIDDSDFDVDKRYVMRKELPIVRKTSKEIHDAMFAKVNESYKSQHKGEELKGTQKQYYKELIDLFISDKATDNYKAGDKYGYKGKDVTSFMKYLNGIYRKVAYTTKKPTSGRLYRNNKIIDMTLAVLTNEMSADKILNPGGFDIPKRTGYMVAAYKNAANKGISWNALQNMSIDELKNLSYTQKDLAWIDTEVQFYKQNSASSSLIGVFAVNKVAHAVLESNSIYLDVDEVCNRQPFTIAGIPFDGRMQIDKKMDADGNLIGKTLGSLVSAAADGVKDPVLNLMNVNMTTANVLNAMLRLGVPFQKAAMFLSQDIISRMLNQFNQRNLTNYEPLSKIISDAITEFEKDNEISEDSNIKTEDLTEDELVEGLLPTEHKATDYKVLLAFQKMLQISEALRNPTFATRFNSISSAVGPLIIDNLIMEHKMEQFRDSNTKDSTTHFYDTDDADGVNVDIDDIFYDHPVLKQFARTVDIAKDIFSDMPAGSEGFRNILDTLPSSLQDKVYRDKKLLSSLSDFYQSYLLIASGVVNPNQLKNYVDGFPKWFNDQKFKEKYPNNALIQAIRLNVSRKTNRPFLQINITGMDTQQKEELSSAWIDLHKENPELSTRLFIYNFFRAGIGFSPKTFMALVPLYVKEHLSVKKADGTKASYVDTYRHFPEVAPKIVIDQFVRNNWNNNKLVPWKGGKGTKYSFDYGKGILEVRNPNDIADLQGTPYIKTRGKGQTYLWKLISSDKDLLRYTSIKPLGDNGEYIEMNTSDIKNSLSNTTKTEEDNSASELQEQSPVEDTPVESKENVTEESKKVSEFVDLVMKQNPKLNETEATNRFEDMKKNPKPYAKFIANVLKQKGLTLNPDEALNEFKKYC